MPRKKTADQPAAEPSPLNDFAQAIKEFKKEPSTWNENGLYESVAALVTTESAELDSAKMLDTAVRLFKSSRSLVASQLLMEAAALYKSDYVAKIAAKFGFRAATAEQLTLPLDADDQDN